MVAVIDYDAGNIMSVCKAVEYLGEEVSGCILHLRDTIVEIVLREVYFAVCWNDKIIP